MNMNDFIRNGLIAGGSNIITQGMFHPLELIKTRIQSHDGQKRNLVPQYISLQSAINQIYKLEGFKGFFKGVFVSILSQTSTKMFYFGFYESFRQKGYSQSNIFLASLKSGILTSLLTSPMNILKTRLLLNTYSYDNSAQNLRYQIKLVYQDHGVLGFYRGFQMSLILSLHGVIQLNAYEFLKNKFNNERNIYLPFINGFLAKTLSISLLYPFSTIKVRLQENQYLVLDQQFKLQKINNQKYLNLYDIVYKMLKIEGKLSFYKGFIINFLRQAPQQGVFFIVYESLRKNL